MSYQVCNCNGSMTLDAADGAALGRVLGTGALPIATALCRRDVGRFLQGIEGDETVVVGCTQEQALLTELAQQKAATRSGSVAPLRFVNIRETAGWGAQGARALPKMAALLAAAALPDPEPVPVVDFNSAGRVLLLGPAQRVLPWARTLAAQLQVSVLITDAGASGAEGSVAAPDGERRYPVASGADVVIDGWLGAFKARWQQRNPIDLETCVRCNACIDVCPEGAIDLRYQVDADKCTGQRDCVRACGAIGAIDFLRTDTARSAEADLVFDLHDRPLLARHQLPQGYFAPGADPARQASQAMALAQLVGEFEKPKFFIYKDKLCAHGRNKQTGCNACIEVCSAEAIKSDGDKIRVNPNLCAGCGACTTVCPSGALAYAYPRAPDMGLRLRTLLSTYAAAGGAAPALLLHGPGKDAALIETLGRQAQAHGKLSGMPARVIPVALQHPASTGLDLWLSAIAWGAANVVILVGADEAPQYVAALRAQLALAKTIVNGLGLAGHHFALLQLDTPASLDTALRDLQPGATVSTAARFNGVPDKRGMLDLAIGHLLDCAVAPKPEQLALAPGAPFGAVTVDKSACTLCMACVGACPASALMDNPDAPQLRFVEKNCVQCGLCATTCPEEAVTLTPRLLLTPVARQAVVLNEAVPHLCIRCAKPFGTVQMIDNMLAKLALHGAFQGNTDRLRMCGDCRVVDMMLPGSAAPAGAAATAPAGAPVAARFGATNLKRST